MSDEERERWDDRHAGAGPVEPAPPEALAAAGSATPPAGVAHVLDVACGTGAQALWAAGHGLAVDALDVSPVAIDRLREEAAARGLDGFVTARVVDLDDGLPTELRESYDLIVCQRFRAPWLWPRLVGLLAPGGLLAVSELSEVGHAGEAGPFRTPAGELAARVRDAGLEVVTETEGDGRALAVARRPHTPVHPRVAAAVARWGITAEVVPCDPDAADTADFCARYGYAAEDSANTIVVVGKAADPVHAACVVLATTRLAVNSVVRRRLGVRKASFAPAEVTLALTGMDIGGVTAVGLPDALPLWVDAAVMQRERIVLGGGNRTCKLIAAPGELLRVPGVEVVEGLAG